MSSVPNELKSVRRFALAASVLLLLLAGALAGYALLRYFGANPSDRLLMPAAALVAAALLGLLAYLQIVMTQKFVTNSFRMFDAVLELGEAIRRQSEYARTIAENSTMSDWAKRTVQRERDYEFLRDAVQGAIVRQDWEAAEHLIRDLDEEFGYRDEAARLRELLAQARRATNEERIKAALERFDKLCAAHKWTQAQAECERLKNIFPGEPRIDGLHGELALRRQEYKRKLLAAYEQAVKAKNLDRAHDLLLQLDQYLRPDEATELKESARSVFRAKLEQLRAQFSIAVSNRQYREAIEFGEALAREFPNSGYAHDISRMMPQLRERAEKEHAPVGAV